MDKLILKTQIVIAASKEKVWEVLTNPALIKLWDDIPENYLGGHLSTGSELVWEGHARMTVSACSPTELLILNLYLPKVNLKSDQYQIDYCYQLFTVANSTRLEIEVGDFSPLPNAKAYHEATQEFLTTAPAKIKKLAESTI